MFESLAEKLKKMRETKVEDSGVTFKPYEEKAAEPKKAEVAPDKPQAEKPEVKKPETPVEKKEEREERFFVINKI